MMDVFDPRQLKRQRARCIPHFKDHGFLFDWTARQIEDRLQIIRRDFQTCVQIGTRGGKIQNEKIKNSFCTDIITVAKPDVVCTEDFLPLAPDSLDFVLSNLCLHWVNDLPGCLAQINQALKPDGLFIAALFGGETLFELRASLAEAEMELRGGVHPRVAPFMDKQQAGALLQRAGFTLPVVDSDILTVTYDSIFKLMKDLRFMGEGNAIAARAKTLARRALFFRAGEIYAQKFSEPDGRIRASFEIIFMLGWRAHESQQKPLKPGSAKTHLSEVLG